ncbi:hypothetical protein P9112_006039 [Eukaryota sp. TZLM1-RC]
MGNTTSHVNIDLLPPNQKLVGLNNLSNSCSFSAVLQILYHLSPLRTAILSLPPSSDNNITNSLRELFACMDAYPRPYGSLEPRAFLSTFKSNEARFQGNDQQDSHEVFQSLLTHLPEFISNIFKGEGYYSTRCMECDYVSTRSQSFFDLPVEITENVSLITAINSLFDPEIMSNDDQIHCDNCHLKTECERKFNIDELPTVLVIQLKRFKFYYECNSFVKLNKRLNIPFNLELKSKNYKLSSFIVHVGDSFFRGHYIAIVRLNSDLLWAAIDDAKFEILHDYQIERYFGSIEGVSNASIYLATYVMID